MSRLTYLGHAGFIVEHGDVRILIDPWFYPAFLESWFPYPDNRSLLNAVYEQTYDYLYISHTHEDHFDKRFLRDLSRETTVISPKYRSKVLARQLKELGFESTIELRHQESAELGPGITATMLLDTSHKEDSGLLLDLEGFRFLDLNDCNTPMSELPSDVDLLAAQFSGAMWYPNCYDYPPRVMAEKVATVQRDLMSTLVRKVALTGAKAYLPSAGPACFLDPELAMYNDRDWTIFFSWEQIAQQFGDQHPDVRVIRMAPGEELGLSTSSLGDWRHDESFSLAEDLEAYRARRADEWNAFSTLSDKPVSVDEVEAYFTRLQRLNKRFLGSFSKAIQVISGSRNFGVKLGEIAQYFVIDGEEPYDPEYTLVVEPRVLRAVIEDRVGWEEALLSMRVGLRRDPDSFDLTFLGLLRYGNHPAQTMQMLRERNNTATIERDGLRMQRYCPHAGEDLTFADVENGRIECPRHHWVWDAATGQCIDKGDIDLRVEVLDSARVFGMKAALATPEGSVR